MTYKDAKELKVKYDKVWAFTKGNGFNIIQGYDVYLKIIGHKDYWKEVFSEMDNRNGRCGNEEALKRLNLLDSIDLTVWLITDSYEIAVRLDEYVRANPEIFRNS